MGREWPAAAVGILPVGALGAAFFFHLTGGLRASDGRVCFLERSGSPSAAMLREGGTLLIADGETPRALAAADICRPDLLWCGKANALPEVLLVCTQPDQLLPIISDYVALLEQLHAAHGLETALSRLPLLVLCSNGIYHERVRRFLVELLEEAMLYGRLPELWSEPMGRIVGKVLRGVTIQTGHRAGSGANAVFHPGPRGRTTLAGGDPAHRQFCAELLSCLGGWFETAETAPVRVEFDKALINLWGNLLGQVKAIDESGAFRLLKVHDILPNAECPELREMARHVFAVGRAVRAYRGDEDFEQVYRIAFTIAAGPREHVPSSLKWIEAQLCAGTLHPRKTGCSSRLPVTRSPPALTTLPSTSPRSASA